MPALTIFVHDLSASGVVRNALAIGEHMHLRGWTVRLVSGRGEGTLDELRTPIEKVVLDRSWTLPVSRAIDLALCIPALGRHLTATRPDILLSAGNHAHLACWAACRGMDRPRRVYRISNDIAHGRESWLRRASYRLLVRDAARLLLVSPHLRHDPALAEGAARAKTVVIPNGVDIARVRARADEPCDDDWLAGDAPVVLGVGRLAAQKNFPALIRAVAIARRTRPVRLIVLGNGEPEAREALLAEAARCSIADHVRLPGAVANPYCFMRHAAVVALPSRWEGSPNVLLEALACGTPVVASRTAGNAAEILDEGHHGLLVDPDDDTALAAAILTQCDPERRVLPGARAEAFALSGVLAGYEAVFVELAAEA